MGEPPQVPVQIVAGSARVEAALRFAAGHTTAGPLAGNLSWMCTQLSALADAPIASVYVLEGRDDLVLRGNHGFDAEALGEVRLKVGQGITGTAVETMRPVTVNDAGLTAQFAYFPQLAEERYPAFLAVPLLVGARPRGALVLQRVAGPFTEQDVLIALLAARPFAALIEHEHPQGASSVLSGVGNGKGKLVGVVRVLSRVLPRREAQKKLDGLARLAARKELEAAFAEEREELLGILEQARAQAKETRAFDELATVLQDGRLVERAGEHVSAGVAPSQALERIAAEAARALASHGPMARRALDMEAFVGAVAHRRARVEPERIRKGEVLVAVHLSGPAALRGWEAGAVGALCSAAAEEGSGSAILTALGLPVVAGVRPLFDWVGNGERVAVDGDKGEVIVNPSAAQAAAWRR